MFCLPKTAWPPTYTRAAPTQLSDDREVGERRTPLLVLGASVSRGKWQGSGLHAPGIPTSKRQVADEAPDAVQAERRFAAAKPVL